jgi:hypothetical protein
MGNLLFQRSWSIIAGPLDVSNLDADFKVRRSLRSEPNTCDLKIYNLQPDSVAQIMQSSSTPNAIVPVSIQAGYGGVNETIYQGNLRAAMTVTSGSEQVTQLSSGDGETNIAYSRVNFAAAPGSSTRTVLTQIVAALGVGEGNAEQALAGMSQTYCSKGVILKGNAADYLEDLCAANGLEYSIQGGALQILPLNTPLPGQALVLSSNSGLIGSPTVDSKGVLSATALITPGLIPGGLVTIQGESVSGSYRIVVVEYEGDTLGNPWYAKIQGEVY